MAKSIAQSALDALVGMPISPDRPLAVLVIQDSEAEGCVDIHHLFSPGVMPDSPAHDLMANTLENIKWTLAAMPDRRQAEMPQGESSPLPAPADSEGGES